MIAVLVSDQRSELPETSSGAELIDRGQAGSRRTGLAAVNVQRFAHGNNVVRVVGGGVGMGTQPGQSHGPALDHPDDTIRAALYPVVAPATLAELVREGRASASALRARTRLRLHASYSSYYRRVIPELLGALQFRSSNTRHAPVIDALALMHRYAGRSNVRFYAAEENVPLDGIVPSTPPTGSRTI